MKNRWLIAASAVGVHISIGSVYAWSVFKKPLAPLMESTDAFATLKEIVPDPIGLAFGLAILFLGLSAAVLGRFVERNGPRVSGMVSACFWAAGLGLAGLGALHDNLWLLLLGYGVIGGIGLGVGYITPVSTLVKWFPDRRGLATGMAIMGFGFGSLVGAPIFAELIKLFGVANTFFIIAAVYFCVMMASAQYLAAPPEGWKPEGFDVAVAKGKAKLSFDLTQSTANEAAKTLPFYGLWSMMFINITCGIGMISIASPMFQELFNMEAAAAAGIVGTMALFNGLGRIGWSTVSDLLSRPVTFIMFFSIEFLAYLSLSGMPEFVIFQGLVFLVMTTYGGGFATLPAYIGDLFGTKQLGAIHGYVLTAWSLAGIVGPQIAGMGKKIGYHNVLLTFVAMYSVALVVSIMMRLYVVRALAIKRQELENATA